MDLTPDPATDLTMDLPMDLTRPRWRKSRRSGGQSECVEVAPVRRLPARRATGRVTAPHKAAADRLIVMRDSKDPDGPRLYFTPDEWARFRRRVRRGEP